MLRGLRQGESIWRLPLQTRSRSIEAHHLWIDQAVWVRSDATQIDPSGPVPLVSFGEDCSCRYTAVNALHRVGRECDFVFTSRSIASLEAAVLAGLGIMVLPRSRALQTALTVWEDPPLPDLPELYCGIYLREGGNRAALEELSDEIAAGAAPAAAGDRGRQRSRSAAPAGGGRRLRLTHASPHGFSILGWRGQPRLSLRRLTVAVSKHVLRPRHGPRTALVRPRRAGRRDGGRRPLHDRGPAAGAGGLPADGLGHHHRGRVRAHHATRSSRQPSRA